MHIDYGVCLTNYGDVTSPEASIGTAKLAEDLGFASVWVSDHILVPHLHLVLPTVLSFSTRLSV